MLYWSRTGDYLDLLAWLVMTSFSWLGGWLLCVHVFSLRPRERLFTGVACGTLLLMFAGNLLAQALPLSLAFWVSAILILAAGAIAALRSPQRPRLPLGDFQVWGQWLTFAGFFVFFILINRGLALFDDYANLPIVATLATGDVPPHFYLNPEKILYYHHGLHLLAASLVDIGGFFPFSALDTYKAFSMSLSLILTWLWYRRYIRGSTAWLWLGVFILFAGGSRWLLLFLPQGLLANMSQGVQLIGSAAQTADSLPAALVSGWNIAGDGPLPFPFAFVNGIESPLTMAMGSRGAMPTLVLLMLLARRRWKLAQGLLAGLLLASVPLLSEPVFVMVVGGIVAGMFLRWLLRYPRSDLLSWLWVLLPGAIFVPLMGGGSITSLRNWLLSPSGEEAALNTIPLVNLRWPPALPSAHLGELSLTEPGQLVIALAEIGPLLLLAVPVTWAALGYIRSRKLLLGGLAVMAAISFLIPIFIRFVERDRDIVRLASESLKVWALLGLPYLWLAFRGAGKLKRFSMGAAYAISILGGLALLPFQMVAIAQPQASNFIDQPDALLSRAYWNRLEAGAWVLDPAYPYRPMVLFGRPTGPAYESVYIRLPEFRALLEALDPVQLAQSGYDYVYLDRETWQALTSDQRKAFQQPCVRLLDQQKTGLGDFRRLLDIQKCAAETVIAPETP